MIQINELYNHLRTASYRCPQQYEFLLKDHLEDAFSARAWTKSDIGPRCPDWACIANIRPKDRPQISGFWPRLMRQSETSQGIWRSLNITCSQPNEQSN